MVGQVIEVVSPELMGGVRMGMFPELGDVFHSLTPSNPNPNEGRRNTRTEPSVAGDVGALADSLFLLVHASPLYRDFTRMMFPPPPIDSASSRPALAHKDHG